MSILDLYDNGTLPHDKRADRLTWLGEAYSQDYDTEISPETTAETREGQSIEDDIQTPEADDKTQQSESRPLDNSSKAVKIMRHVIDYFLLFMMMAGVALAGGSYGHAWLDTVMFIGGVAITLGCATLAGICHSKWGW